MLKEECNTTNLAALRSWGMGKQAKGAVRSELWLLLFISFLSSPCHNGTTLPLRQGDKTLLKISHSSPLRLPPPPYHSFALRSRPVLVSSSHSTPALILLFLSEKVEEEAYQPVCPFPQRTKGPKDQRTKGPKDPLFFYFFRPSFSFTTPN